MTRVKIAIVMGTRPEAIKLAPVYHRLRKETWANLIVVNAGQHQHILSEAMESLGLPTDFRVVAETAGESGRSLNQLASMLLTKLDEALAALDPELVMVQGDTTSAFIAALVAFQQRRRVVHVEAGLRTGRSSDPFPEEMNRRMLSELADLHLAPTLLAQENLIREGHREEQIITTGNTSIDALLHLAPKLTVSYSIAELIAQIAKKGPLILVTAHRRESWGVGLDGIAEAIWQLIQIRPDLSFVLPMHPNPVVRQSFVSRLSSAPAVHLLEALSYADLTALMRASTLVLTDSGGLQEEAPSLGKPVLVLRDSTERAEGISAGVSKLVGTEPTGIVEAALGALNAPRTVGLESPYGDGFAADRICHAIAVFVGKKTGNAPPNWSR